MTHTPEQILSLLPLLDKHIADELESETLYFKECPTEAKLRELSKIGLKMNSCNEGIIWSD